MNKSKLSKICRVLRRLFVCPVMIPAIWIVCFPLGCLMEGPRMAVGVCKYLVNDLWNG